MSVRSKLHPNYLADERVLAVDLPSTHRVASWALLGGGLAHADSVVWCEVKNAELSRDVDPYELLGQRLERASRPLATGLLTSASVKDFRHTQAELAGVHVECVLTAGFGNALAVGDPPTQLAVGTINILCVVSASLTDAALLEALSIVAEARTIGVHRRKIASTASQERATGTGTDCIVVACPNTAAAEQFAGKHTALGHLLGHAVLEALLPQ